MARAFPPRPDIPRRPDAPSARTRRRRRASALAAAGLALILVAGSAGWVLRDRTAEPVAAPTASSPSVTGAGSPPEAVDTLEGPYRFLARTDEGPLGWNPCREIPYEVNLRDAPEGALRIVQEATSRAQEATGFTFTYLGTTRRGPLATWRDDFLDDAFDPQPVLIAWLPPGRFAELAPPSRAAAVGYPRRGRGPDYPWYTSGGIVVNTGAHARPAFVTRGDLGPILLHEWGHVLGLAHVPEGDQIMWSNRVPGADENPAPFLTTYGDGDLAGLARLAAVSCEAP